MSTLDKLPDHVVIEILIRVPIGEWPHLCCVKKQWAHLFRQDLLWNAALVRDFPLAAHVKPWPGPIPQGFTKRRYAALYISKHMFSVGEEELDEIIGHVYLFLKEQLQISNMPPLSAVLHATIIGNKEVKCFHLAGWRTVITRKRDGGLGIRNLRRHNKSLLWKWLWRYNTEENALWRRVVNNKYGQHGLWISNFSTSSVGTSIWMSIRNHWEEFFGNTGFRIGNGQRIIFQSDNWLGHGPFKDLFPDLFSLVTVSDVNLGDSWSQQGWNLSFRRLINDWEVGRVSELLKILDEFKGTNNASDSLFWNCNNGRNFTVKCAYHLLSTGENTNSGWPWKAIWKAKAPYKVVCFSWLVARNACLTHENLQKRGNQLTSRSFLCQEESENINHLFLHCKVTGILWQLFLNLAGIRWVMPGSTKDLMRCWKYVLRNGWKSIWWNMVPACIWWTIWKERNARCFEDKSSPLQRISLNCFLNFHFWCKEHCVDDAEYLIEFFDTL